MFLHPKKGQHLNIGQNTHPQCVHFMGISTVLHLHSQVQLIRCGSSTSQSGAQTTSGVEMVMLWSLSLRKCPRVRGRLGTTPLSSMDCESDHMFYNSKADMPVVS